ncbi:MAG: redoxin domain-containing protein [Planctomycetota bacterium]
MKAAFALLALSLFSGTYLPEALNFRLPDTSGKEIAIEAGENLLTAVCFLGTECPMARSYASTLNQLHADFAGQKVQILGVMSNRQDSVEDVKEYIQTLGVQFPVLLDKGNVVANQFGATRTPEVYLLNGDLKLQYHGRIDDQYAPSVARADAKRQDLRIAIEELLAGKPVSVPETKALGCIIGKMKETKEQPPADGPNFVEHVFPMLEQNCIECHRSGEIGPFAMDDYEEVVGWADTMMETIDDKRMPPWHADPGIGEFANARHMAAADKELLRDWIKAGCPSGDLSKQPNVKSFDDGWAFEPKDIFEMRNRPFAVPADGIVEYQYFVIDPGFTEDKWVSTAQIIPGARDVVHHAIVYVRPPDGSRFQGIGWLSAYVPGQRAAELPPGRARLIPAGSKLVFQMHYTPVGVEREDTSVLGLTYANEADVTHEVFTTAAINQDFDIPPNANDFKVHAATRQLPREGELLAATPHMHFRGKACTLVREPSDATQSSEELKLAALPEGEELLKVSKYDFNWQHTYQFKSPLPLEQISKLHFEAVFDNTNDNPFNPDAEQWVYWGDQTWEEMAVIFFEVSVPRTPSGNSRLASKKSDPDQEKIETYVSRVLEKADSNGDGQIHESEGSIFVRHFNFEIFDRNRDGVATEEEIRKVAKRLYK